MDTNPMDLSGKRILVTGASSGIGKAASQLFSNLGAKVVLLARNEERLQSTLESLAGEGHAKYVFDLGATDEIPGLMKKMASEQGHLSGMFHCAGITLVWPVTLLKQKYIDSVFSSSIEAALLLARGFCQKGVKDQGSTSIVFMSSVAGVRGVKGLSIYSASKAAIDGAVRSLAVELAPRGIRINSIAAAGIESVMHSAWLKNFTEEQLFIYTRKHLMGFGTAEDVSNAAAFLLSDASRWITGTTMLVDGGFSCW
jgi:NAD(P)-dependent dehydrogenase (short-subunit alcohol dehydrogenase family)